MAAKIKVKTPLVEIDGDEMTRVMWKIVKDVLILPRLDVSVEYYDLHIKNRDHTDDRVTTEAAHAIKRLGVGVKCATITPNEDRVKEYGLKKAWKSPNATIRSLLDGTVFRKPIITRNIKRFIPTWEKPIIIGRHAYGDVYASAEIRVSDPGTAEIVFVPAGKGKPETRKKIHDFNGKGIIQGIHNTDESIHSFAKTCFLFALQEKIDLWFSVKDTISKTYDAHFRDVFQKEYEENWSGKFQEENIQYFFTLIDDAVARIIRSEGGILWALKNYDGDVMSDMVASAYGSLAMMSSVLVSPEGCFEYEAAHGTVQKHYYKHLNGEETSTNSMALIFAWTGALRKRGEMDKTPDLVDFASRVEQAAITTIESGILTGDLLAVAIPSSKNRKVSTEQFIHAVAENLTKGI